MEQIIPILVAAVIFGFQAYANYQKEQEKARKRNPGQRPPQQQGGERPVPAEARQPRPAVVRERQPAMRQPAPQPAPVPQGYQEYAGFIDENQLAQQAKQRAKRSQQDLLKPLEVTEDEEDHGDGIERFDLREAVIYATILERPYQ